MKIRFSHMTKTEEKPYPHKEVIGYTKGSVIVGNDYVDVIVYDKDIIKKLKGGG